MPKYGLLSYILTNLPGNGTSLCRLIVQSRGSASQSIIVVAFSLPVGSFRSSGSISSSHTPSKGSGRVRHRCSGFACDGNEPLCHLRAERTLIPAFAAAVSCVLPSIRFCLNSLTCRSVINGTSIPNDYPISTGKNSRLYRQDQLSLITMLQWPRIASSSCPAGGRPAADVVARLTHATCCFIAGRCGPRCSDPPAGRAPARTWFRRF